MHIWIIYKKKTNAIISGYVLPNLLLDMLFKLYFYQQLRMILEPEHNMALQLLDSNCLPYTADINH